MGKKISLGILIGISGILLLLFLSLKILYRPLAHEDFGTIKRMSSVLNQIPDRAALSEREVRDDLDQLPLSLSFIDGLIFGKDQLTLHFYAGQSDRLYNYSFSQFEVGPGSGHFFDATFLFRPRNNVAAPLLFGDIIRPLAGVKGSFYMDFYSVDSNLINVEEFLGENLAQVEEGFALMEAYQKREDRGELTWFLDPYKSPYRIEVNEPENPEEKEAYYDALFGCFNLYLDAYIDGLARAEISESIGDEVDAGYKEMTDLIQQHDIAIKLGKRVFPQEIFPRYFFDGFWRQN